MEKEIKDNPEDYTHTIERIGMIRNKCKEISKQFIGLSKIEVLGMLEILKFATLKDDN
jgi:hypothetical protein